MEKSNKYRIFKNKSVTGTFYTANKRYLWAFWIPLTYNGKDGYVTARCETKEQAKRLIDKDVLRTKNKKYGVK